MKKIGYPETLIIILAIGAPITGILYLIYFSFNLLQVKIYLSGNDYSLIPNRFLNMSFVIAGSVFFMLVLFKIDFGGYMGKIINIYRKISTKLIFIVAVAVFLIVLTYHFFSYAIVSTNGILYKENLFQRKIQYGWTDIKKADIFFTWHHARHGTKCRLHYVLSTNDNRQFDMKLSRQFWNKIITIDRLLKERNIKINRGMLYNDSYFDLLTHESVDITEGVRILETIFDDRQ